MTTLRGSPVAIVPACGESTRMGRNKLFEPIDGVPMVERAVRAFLQATRVDDVVVVVPVGRAEDFSWLRSTKVHVVENPAPQKGMISSIRTALDTIWAKGRDFLVCPADVPFVKPEIVDRVVQDFMVRAAKIVIPAYKGLGGHPGLYASSLRVEFFLRGDTNGPREILTRHRGDTTRISVHDPDVCFDVDTPEDLAIAADAGARWARVEDKVAAKQRGRMSP
jgi:molybdenum cofactor cytidylyltransferase